MKVDVFSIDNKKVGDIELDDSVFGAVVRPNLFWEVVRMQMATRRAGTSATRRVGEVRGSKKKPFRQKGTGRARQGSKRGMILRGGGTVHGPQPRSYEYRMPKKAVKVALRSALSLRTQEKKLHVIKTWTPSKPKTKDAAKVLRAFDAVKALVVDKAENENLHKAVRNLEKAKFVAAEALNVYDILKYDHLFISADAIPGITERLQTEASRSERAKKEG
jgi:large subunit ribosomal protein L4